MPKSLLEKIGNRLRNAKPTTPYSAKRVQSQLKT